MRELSVIRKTTLLASAAGALLLSPWLVSAAPDQTASIGRAEKLALPDPSMLFGKSDETQETAESPEPEQHASAERLLKAPLTAEAPADLFSDIASFFEENFPAEAPPDSVSATDIKPAAGDVVAIAATPSEPEDLGSVPDTAQAVPVESVDQLTAAEPQPLATEDAPLALNETVGDEQPAVSQHVASAPQETAHVPPQETVSFTPPSPPEAPPTQLAEAAPAPLPSYKPSDLSERVFTAPATELKDLAKRVPVPTLQTLQNTAMGIAPERPEPAAINAASVVPPLEQVIAPKAPRSELSSQTREILSMLPGGMAAPKPSKGESVNVNRVTPEIESILGPKAKEEKFDAVGLSIRVRRPGLDSSHELANAYQSLMGGNTPEAIQIYQNILSVEPTNEEALFGLAATYHRLGNLDKARPLYGMLLKQNPNHREGVNNFLVLVSDESPEDALPELERLEQRNRDFSPIPAQMASVLEKLGFWDQAREKMLRAIELSPDNLTYKYNLAVMLDRQGKAADAAALYRMLIEARLRGEAVPASADAMQKRLNFLTASALQKVPGG